MPLPAASPVAIARRVLRAVLLALAWLLAPPAMAQSLESVLRPGDVVAAHAKWEDDCAACHVRFDRSAQDARCTDCHTDVGADVRERRGYHGRLDPQPCRSCHTDHKGRGARIVELDPKAFDHARTDYALRGRHAGVECRACHVAGRKWREAPQSCVACHRQDDKHQGSLGSDCASCHAEAGWKRTTFDHARTRFPLRGGHASARCDACHRSAVFADAPQACIACHRGDDAGQKGHQGRFGERCETCHDEAGWKPSRFRHERDTAFALRGAHQQARCAACHAGPVHDTRTPTDCLSCHRADDRHRGSLGTDCAACHTERRWTEAARFDHDRTAYPLTGRHRDTACSGCHAKPGLYRVADQRCTACHAKDDRHEGQLGDRCESCHAASGWKPAQGFDHAKARFALRGAHGRARCADCHRGARFRDAPSACIACHRGDDRHAGQLGEDCGACHAEQRWTGVAFDHAKARFPLTGRHLTAACSDCHATPRFRDAARDCLSCHRADDRHRGTLGSACASCHNTRAWSLWAFDHGRRTRFALEGAHRTLACSRCHGQPAPAGQAVAPIDDRCVACHRKDDRHDGAFGDRCDRCHGDADWRWLRRPAGTAARPPEAAR